MKYCFNGIFVPKKFDPLNIDVLCASLVPGRSKVLEIGCADGFLGEYLIKVKKCQVTGVEMDKEAGERAGKRGLKTIIGNIQTEEMIEKVRNLGKFDVVLATAVIEHLSDPWKALKMWKDFLNDKGVLIVSTSNIAHWSSRIKLITGKFEYEEYGIFDNTHLRFFTIDSFRQLIEKSGYKVEYFGIDPIGGGLPKISKFLAKFLPGLFAYQMVIKAVK